MQCIFTVQCRKIKKCRAETIKQFINCFLLTVGEDFVLCVLAAALAKRLMPVFSDMRG